MKKIEEYTIKEAKERIEELEKLQKLFNISTTESQSEDSHWKIGKPYFIRTVTHHLTGELVSVTKQELVLKDAAWIAEDGRFADVLVSNEFSEVEPFPDGEVILGRGSIIDAVIIQKLPKEQK